MTKLLGQLRESFFGDGRKLKVTRLSGGTQCGRSVMTFPASPGLHDDVLVYLLVMVGRLPARWQIMWG